MKAATVVVDASVAVKWVLQEAGRPAAIRLLRQYHDGEATLIAPHLLLSEAGNVLWKHARRGMLTRQQASEAFELLLDNCPILTDSAGVFTAALHLALAHGGTVYDCLYLALALDERCDLVTADEKFFRGFHQAFPSLRLLGEV